MTAMRSTPRWCGTTAGDEAPDRARSLRAIRFFLPIVVLQGNPPNLGRFAVSGDLYLWADRQSPDLAGRLTELCRDAETRESRALPFRTEEILYFTPEGDVFGHDWVKGVPRELRLSALQHQIISVMASHQRGGSGHAGLTVGEVGSLLGERGWARSDQTMANEMSARLPRVLRAEGIHPNLYHASGTRQKKYTLSTPPSCLRSLG